MPVITEAALHKYTLQLLYACARDDVLWLHIPNGVRARGSAASRAGVWQRAMGARPGAADWLFVLRGHAMFLELKSTHGRQSNAQVKFEAMSRGAGSTYAVAHSPDDVLKVLRSWAVLREGVHTWK